GVDVNALFGLKNLTRLRELTLYHNERVHRLEKLASNKAFANLTHLSIHPHNVGAWWRYARTEDAPDGYSQDDGFLPLSVVRPLWRSTHLTNLTHLQLRVSSMGDEGCEEIVRSGILKRLKVLDLRHGCVTDTGVDTLAACPDLRRLERLDLDRNRL